MRNTGNSNIFEYWSATGLNSRTAVFVNDFFSVVQNKNNSASQFHTDLDKDSDWAYTWKMSFNPDPLI